MMKFMTVGLLLQTLSVNAFAGDKGGNGGDAVICPQGIYMLDSVESARRAQPLLIPSSEMTLQSKIDLLIKRLDSKDPVLAKDLMARSKVMINDIENYERTGESEQENISFTTGDLVNIADEGATYVPDGCKIEQLIIQNKSPLPGDKKFLIQANIWNRMELDEKAAGVIHEAIYGYLIDNNIYNSPSTRYLNGLIISDRISSIKTTEYFSLLSKLSFPRKRIPNFDLNYTEVKAFMSCSVNDQQPEEVEISIAEGESQGKEFVLNAETRRNRKKISISLYRQDNNILVNFKSKGFFSSAIDLFQLENRQGITIHASTNFGADYTVNCKKKTVTRFPEIIKREAVSCSDGIYHYPVVHKYTDVSGASTYSIRFYTKEEEANVTEDNQGLIFKGKTSSFSLNLVSEQAVLTSSEYNQTKDLQCKVMTDI